MSGGPLRVSIVGVGNCASAFVQGLAYYRDAGRDAPGLISVDLGGYQVSDIDIVSAFDVNASKVGQRLEAAMFAAPNNTLRFATPASSNVIVQRGPVLDGIGKYLADEIELSDQPAVDVVHHLRASGTEILVSYLPVGAQRATEHYAAAALEAGCAFVNCIPVFIASDPSWAARFATRGLPLIGDDIKSQVGATIVHRTLVNLLQDRGVKLDRTYQLKFGGNADFQNMLERERLTSKKISKTNAVTSQLDVALEERDVHVGPSDFVLWLTDRKWAHIRMEGTAFGGVPLSIELKLEVWDSPNSAGIVIDAVRCAKLALDRGIGGPLIGPSSYYMKSPPRQFSDEEAREQVRLFVDDGRPKR